eukprot:scaffold2106_cov127-Alexandrium_tamarense.AAC.1
MEYCADVHDNDEEKMLKAMVSSYDGRVSGGEIGGKSAAKLIGFVMEAGIDNVRVAKSLEDLKDSVYETTMKSMMEYCFDVHDNDEEKMLKAMVSSYDGRVSGGKSAAKLIGFVMEAGINNVRVAKSLEDLKDSVYETTMKSMMEYCADVHDNDEETMLKAIVSSYDGRVSGGANGGEIGGANTAKLIGFVMEAGIDNVRVAKSLEDLKDSVYETTMKSMMEYCFDVHDNDEEMMLKAMVSSYDGRVSGGANGGEIGGANTAKLIGFVMEAGIDNVRVAKSLEDLEGNVHPTTMKSMMEYCADVHDNDEETMLKAMVSSYDGRVSGGESGGKSAAKLIGFVMEAGINNVRVARLLEDLKDSVYKTTMKSMLEYCADVHDNDEKKMLKAMVSSYDGRVSGRVSGGANTAKLIGFVMEAGINNVRVAKLLEDLEGNVHPMTMKSMMEYCADVNDNDEKMMLKAMVSSYDGRKSGGEKGSELKWMREQMKWFQNYELMKVKSEKTGKEKLVQFNCSGKYKMREDIIGSDGKSVKCNHRQWSECETWHKETSTDGRITVIADRMDSLVKSLLDKYANYKKSLS